MTTPKEQGEREDCRHNWVLVTRSSWRSSPYRRCTKCGHVREIGAHLNQKGQG